jgi:hypothetical protein
MPYERDAAGGVTATIDALGHRTERVLDARGAATSRTDVREETWTSSTLASSSTSTDPLGHTTTSLRGAYGLPTSTTFPGGASTSASFFGTTSLDASGDYPTLRTDEVGRERRFAYSAGTNPGELERATELGGPSSVTDQPRRGDTRLGIRWRAR